MGTEIPEVVISGRRISREEPVFIIAEVGVNHNGSIDNALKMVEVAARSKVDAVKFQLYKTDELVSFESPLMKYQSDEHGKKFQKLVTVRNFWASFYPLAAG